MGEWALEAVYVSWCPCAALVLIVFWGFLGISGGNGIRSEIYSNLFFEILILYWLLSKSLYKIFLKLYFLKKPALNTNKYKEKYINSLNKQIYHK